MRFLSILPILLVTTICLGQTMTGIELLDRAIAYHDPDSKWSSFTGDFRVTMSTPDKSDRVSDISINLPRQTFEITYSKDALTINQVMSPEGYQYKLNGSSTVSEEDKKKHRLNPKRTKTWSDYYTYLYGLPMKLKDPGTNVDPIVIEKEFKGKIYKALKVTYDQSVGRDTWYFYFDPNTYAMEVYQFYKDETKNDGEYILLTGEEIIEGIKMPKTRAWYYNKDEKYLGTDVLSSF